VEGSGPPVRESVEFARIVAFTDGVFAIAITLLVLSLEVPADVSASTLHDYLLDSWPQLFAYFLSFAVIGRFWITHHRMFSLVRSFDSRLMVLNLVSLSLVVLIPFPTELLGEYGSEADAVVLYAFVVGATALLNWVLLRHALGRGHVHPHAHAAASELRSGSLWVAIVFFVSIPVAVVNPLIGQLTWLGLTLGPLLRRR
jgi:TMEM175 potassium channel family protein